MKDQKKKKKPIETVRRIWTSHRQIHSWIPITVPSRTDWQTRKEDGDKLAHIGFCVPKDSCGDARYKEIGKETSKVPQAQPSWQIF